MAWYSSSWFRAPWKKVSWQVTRSGLIFDPTTLRSTWGKSMREAVSLAPSTFLGARYVYSSKPWWKLKNGETFTLVTTPLVA